MPRLPIDYQKCVVYKLCCRYLNVTDTYVGHTTQFRERKSQHKSGCNNVNDKSYNLKVYDFIREHGGWDNWSMIEIEKIPCNDSQEACKRERYWIENLRATLNSNIPNRTKKEYYENNISTIKELGKEYYQNNIEKITKKKNEYYQTNIITIKEKSKEYYQTNIITIKEKSKAVTNCECSGHYQHTNKIQHLKSKKHISYCSQIKS